MQRLGLLLTFLMLIEFSVHSQHASPKIKEGVLNLENWNLKQDGSLKVSGQWRFYKNTFLHPKLSVDTQTFIYVSVPGVWNDEKQLKNRGYGSYRIKIIPNTANTERLAFKFNYIGVAFTAFINGKKVYSAGKVGTSKETELPQYKPGIVAFDANADTLDVVIWISNYHYYRAGIWSIVWLGDENVIRNDDSISNFFDWFLIGCLLIMGVYHISLYLMRRREPSNLIFGILTLLFVIRIGVNGNMFFSVLLNLPWNLIVFSEYFTFYLLPFVVAVFLRALFPDEHPKLLVNITCIMAVLFLIPVFTTSIYFYSRFPFIYRIYAFLISLYLITYLVKSVIKKREGALIFLIGFILFTCFAVVDLLSASYLLYTRQYAPLGILIFNFSQSFLLNLRFTSSFNKTEEMANLLDFQNKNLEQIVKDRTQEVEQQKEDISIKVRSLRVAYDEINEQHSIVLHQKEEIEHYNKNINAAIRYAYNIQKSMLPSDTIMKDVLNDYFLLYKPKDIVSGDFYWVKQNNKMKYIAVADCTGHGVPGAFMSILGITLLTETVNRYSSISPSDVLDWLQVMLKSLIKQEENSLVSQKEGMDIVFCLYDIKNMQLYYAGVRMNMILVRNNEIIELNVEKTPMGINPLNKKYCTHSVKLEKCDMLYIYTDGYVDQFGGDRNKKYSTKRLYEQLKDINSLKTEDQQDILEKSIYSWMKTQSNQIDDITILGVRI